MCIFDYQARKKSNRKACSENIEIRLCHSIFPHNQPQSINNKWITLCELSKPKMKQSLYGWPLNVKRFYGKVKLQV